MRAALRKIAQMNPFARDIAAPENYPTVKHAMNCLLYTHDTFKGIRDRYQRESNDVGNAEAGRKDAEKLEDCRKYIQCPHKLVERYFLDIAREVISTNHHFPAYLKYMVLSGFITHFKPEVFVETGTLFGDTCLFFRDEFKALYTIDIDPWCHSQAERLYQEHTHITALLGDSGVMIHDILKEIRQPALFFLDGHFTPMEPPKGSSDYYRSMKSDICGSTPIMKELEAIAAHSVKEHVIIIDDVGCFENCTTTGYPALEYMEEMCGKLFPRHHFRVQYGVITLSPEPLAIAF